MGASFEIKLGDTIELLNDLKKDAKKYKGAKVGYIKDKQYENGFSLIENAIVQEFGNDKIPSRPFIRKTLKKKESWIELFDNLLSENLTLRQILLQVANQVRSDMIASIDSNIPPPNAKSTIQQKGSSHTLIDTGLLRGSIQVELVKNGNKSE